MLFIKRCAEFDQARADAMASGSVTVAQLLDQQAARFGDRPFVSVGGRAVSFSACRDGAARFAGHLSAAGIRRGDRVALMMRNRLEFIVGFMGCQWLGAVAVPLNTALRGAQLAHPLQLASVRHIVADGNLLAHLQVADPTRTAQIWLADLEPHADREDPRVSAMPAIEDGVPVELQMLRPDEPAAILLTSGTTGPSKGVTYPPGQLVWWARIMAVMNSLRPDSVSFTTLPLFHIHALSALVQSLLTGAHCVISERFSASRFWAEACEARATHGCLVGAMGAMLLAQPPSAADRDHSIHTIFSSSLRSSVWAEFAQRFGIARRVGGYGSTETNAAFFAENGWDLQGRMGEVVPGFEARVIDPEGRDVPADTPGELLLRTELPEAFALGYWNQPEETAKSWRSGWFYTGDLVCRDQAGGYRFVGRLKESIRRRGENVSAWEVEQAVLSHPAIRDVAAFGVPSDIGDEDIMIVAVIREGHSITPETLLRHLDGRIAYFAIPRFVEFADRLPVTETGKLRRTELKQRGVGEHTFDREAIGWKVSRS